MKTIPLSRLLIVFLVFSFAVTKTPLVAQDTVTLTVDPEKVVQQIDEKVYGHFLEHIYHSINGGLWGDLIWNRSFEDSSAAQWKNVEKSVTQTGLETDQRLFFGNADWTDYEFTLEAKKNGGAEGFLVIFRAQNEKEFYWANFGGWANTQHAIERKSAGQVRQGIIGRAQTGEIEEGRWYKIKVRCEGTNFKVFLDDEQVFQLNDNAAIRSGQVGIGTWATRAEFRNFKVVTLDGKTLYEDVPQIVEKEATSKHWEPSGNAKAYLESGDALNGNYYQRIVAGTDGDPENMGGIQQRGLTLKKGETYLLSYWVKSDSEKEKIWGKIKTVLQKNDGTVLAGYTTAYAPESQWSQRRAEFKVKVDVTDAVLCIGPSPNEGSTANFCIDQVSLMPLSWKEKFGGMRPELLNAIAELRPPTIRWPGGCFASAYRWKDGIGAQHERGPYPFSIWDDREVNSFGTDEFIDLCRRVGAEPIIVVNGGTPGWNSKRNPELANVDWVQEACDWLEYCNGPADSTWGKVRAANGHPAPYNVKYWEIDNETQGGVKVEEYIEIVRKFAPALKKVDPSIKIAVAGSHYGPREPWDRPIIEQAGELFDYLSFHQYDDPQKYANGPAEIEKYFRRLKEIIDGSKNPNIKIYDSEWNAQSTDWRTGLYAGNILNMFERNADILEIGGPALFLRHSIATAWDNAFINFDNQRWYPAPNYVVMKLWRDHYAPNLLQLTGEQRGTSVVATKSAEGTTLYLKAVNPTPAAKEFSVQILARTPESAKFTLITGETLRSRNTLERPDAIQAKEASVKTEGDRVRFTLPPLSAGVVEVR